MIEQSALFEDGSPRVATTPSADADEPSSRAGFFMVTRTAYDVLGSHFPVVLACPGAKRDKTLTLRTARVIYVALTDIANERRHAVSSDGWFRAYREHVADRAGVGVRTLDSYARELETAGLLDVRRFRSGRRHEPNAWRLPRGATSGTPTDLEAQPATGTAPRGAASDTPLKKGHTEENVVPFRGRQQRPGQGSRAAQAADRELRRARRADALDELIGDAGA